MFDEFPIIPVPIKCGDKFVSDHEMISKFLKAPLKEIHHGTTYITLMKEFKFLLAQAHRHYNKITFRAESLCCHFTKNPVRAKEAFSFRVIEE